uniref:Proline rich membrane anchor 1 n=1 Tax=Felis catus TaxID=9685 RepID=A0ABI7Z6F6_FELCA
MLLRDLVLRRGCCWPSLLLHCALHPLWGFVQVTHGEPQKSCSKVTDSCQHICQCRPPPLLPPPPPPPPPPRLLSAPAPNSTSCPAEESWWSGLVIVIAVCCASLVFLTVLVIICYKAIKRTSKIPDGVYETMIFRHWASAMQHSDPQGRGNKGYFNEQIKPHLVEDPNNPPLQAVEESSQRQQSACNTLQKTLTEVPGPGQCVTPS